MKAKGIILERGDEVTCFLDHTTCGENKLRCTIKMEDGGISIHPLGYEDIYGSEPIHIENYKGKLSVVCWPNKESSDSVNINMEGAKI